MAKKKLHKKTAPTSGNPEKLPQPVVPPCRRCGAPGPVGEDGFCADCEKALEQACL